MYILLNGKSISAFSLSSIIRFLMYNKWDESNNILSEITKSLWFGERWRRYLYIVLLYIYICICIYKNRFKKDVTNWHIVGIQICMSKALLPPPRHIKSTSLHLTISKFKLKITYDTYGNIFGQPKLLNCTKSKHQ